MTAYETALRRDKERRARTERVLSDLMHRPTRLPQTDSERATTPDFRYKGEPSERYVAAVIALQALEEAEPGNAVNAAAEVIRMDARRLAERDLGTDENWLVSCPHTLVGEECQRGVGTARADCIDLHDHTSLWVKDGEPYAFMSQPYGVGWETLQAVVSLCQRLGLEAEIDQRYAFHYPNWAVGVIIRRPDPAAAASAEAAPWVNTTDEAEQDESRGTPC